MPDVTTRTPTPAGEVDALVDGGETDCGSGLLLLITRSVRRLAPGHDLGVRSAEASVVTDLPVWADLVGHEVVGIGQGREAGFRVRVAATPWDEDPGGVAALHARLDETGIARADRVVRPVAAEGFAQSGVHVCLDTLEPEPTITADGAWWHPVAVTDPNLRIHDAPLPLSEVFGVVRDTLAVQDAAAATGREVFRCA